MDPKGPPRGPQAHTPQCEARRSPDERAGRIRLQHRVSWQQGVAAQQTLRAVRARNDLAAGLGKELGRGEVLLRPLPPAAAQRSSRWRRLRLMGATSLRGGRKLVLVLGDQLTLDNPALDAAQARRVDRPVGSETRRARGRPMELRCARTPRCTGIFLIAMSPLCPPTRAPHRWRRTWRGCPPRRASASVTLRSAYCKT